MLQREEQVGKFVGGKVEQNEQISKGKKKTMFCYENASYAGKSRRKYSKF